MSQLDDLRQAADQANGEWQGAIAGREALWKAYNAASDVADAKYKAYQNAMAAWRRALEGQTAERA